MNTEQMCSYAVVLFVDLSQLTTFAFDSVKQLGPL